MMKIAKIQLMQVIQQFGQINILVNNAGKQFPTNDFLKITPDQLQETFSTNIYSMFYLTQAALPHMSKGDTIVNTSSITAYQWITRSYRLFRNKRGYYFFYSFPRIEFSRKRNSCKCRGTRSYLDSAHSRNFR